MVTRDIRTNREGVVCDVCRRTLLAGENAEVYLAGGERRRVCDLCAERAQHGGWIREADFDDLSLLGGRQERRSRLVDRFRARRERAREEPEPLEYEEPESEPEAIEPEPEPEPVAPSPAPEPRPARQVHAIPTDNGQKIERALELFNRSEHVRTVSGVGRSLGPPLVSAHAVPDDQSVVRIAVVWELSWYRFEVELEDESSAVVRTAQGSEVSELEPAEQIVNAAADESGRLHIV